MNNYFDNFKTDVRTPFRSRTLELNKVNYERSQWTIHCDKNLKENFVLSSLKRQKELSIGRYCASMVLNELTGKPTVVPMQKNRSPNWPLGIIGSLTHNNRFVSVVATHSSCAESLGIDSEDMIQDESTLKAVEEMVLGPLDKQIMASSSLNRETRATLVFSAKESLFKALSQLKCKIDDPLDIHMIDHNEVHQTLSMSLKSSLKEIQGRTFKINYCIAGEAIHTLALIRNKTH